MGNDQVEAALTAAAKAELATIALTRWDAVAPHLGLRLRCWPVPHRGVADLPPGASIPVPGAAGYRLEVIIETANAVVPVDDETRSAWGCTDEDLVLAAATATRARRVTVAGAVMTDPGGGEITVRAVHGRCHLAALLLAPEAVLAWPVSSPTGTRAEPTAGPGLGIDDGATLVAAVGAHLLITAVTPPGSDLGAISRRLIEPCQTATSSTSFPTSAVFRYHRTGRLSIVVVDPH